MFNGKALGWCWLMFGGWAIGGCGPTLPPCTGRCMVFTEIVDAVPMDRDEFIVHVRIFDGPDPFYVSRDALMVPPDDGSEMSFWRVRCPPDFGPWPDRVCGLDDGFPREWSGSGVVMAEYASGWLPAKPLSDPEEGVAVNRGGTWMGPETFPDWAFEMTVPYDGSGDWYYYYGHAQPSPPAVQYRACRSFVGDPASGDVYGKDWCLHPDLPGKWNNYEGTSWAE